MHRFFSRRLLQSDLGITCLIGLAYFVLQLTQLSQYGVTWDEPLHRNWGRLAIVALGNGDRSLIALMPGNGQFYGPIFFMLNVVLSELLMLLGMSMVAANHVLTLIVASAVVGSIYRLGSQFGGRKLGLCSVVFTVFFLQFIAHSHYNPKDIPLLLAVLVTAIAFLSAIRRSSRTLLLLSAFLFGFSLAMKVSAIVMAPVFGIVYLFHRYEMFRKHSTTIRSEIFLMLGGMIAVLLGCYLFWPTAWADPLLIARSFLFFSSSDFWAGHAMFLGQVYAGADLPWYYVPLEFLMGMPLLMIGFFAIGLFILCRNIFQHKDRLPFLFLFLWIVVPIIFSMKPGLVRYDGMRQFYFVLPAVVVTAALGLRWLIDRIEATGHSWAMIAITFIFALSFANEITVIHPFEGSYRNEVVRWMVPERMDRVLEIEYWGASMLQGVEWLNDHANRNATVCVPTAGLLVEWYDARPDFRFACSEESDYIMFFTRYSAENQAKLAALTPVFTIERMGAELLKIYRVR